MERMSRRSGLSFLQYSVVAAALLPTLVSQAAIVASNTSLQNVSPKVRVTVFFESLCSDSSSFFANQLQPTYSRLEDIMELEFVPFGKAVARPFKDGNRVKIEFQCQHGSQECLGNRIMSCAQSFLSSKMQHKLFSCMMAAQDPVRAGPTCSDMLGLNWSTIASCSDSRLGPVLLYMNGRKTAAIRPRLYFVPTITINGAYDRNSLHESRRSLLTQVCRAYGAPHPNCH